MFKIVRDPCGIACLIITYIAVLYADYVVMRWIILHEFTTRQAFSFTCELKCNVLF